MYDIEKNIQMSLETQRKLTKRKYPFADMEVGDSFQVEKEERERVRTACYNEGVRKKKLFKVGKDMQGNIRCWRLE